MMPRCTTAPGLLHLRSHAQAPQMQARLQAAPPHPHPVRLPRQSQEAYRTAHMLNTTSKQEGNCHYVVAQNSHKLSRGAAAPPSWCCRRHPFFCAPDPSQMSSKVWAHTVVAVAIFVICYPDSYKFSVFKVSQSDLRPSWNAVPFFTYCIP